MIVIYGAEWCTWCTKAKQLAENYQLAYTWRNIDNDQYKQELKAILPSAKTIPQIWWHGNHLGGYEEFAAEIEQTRNFGQDKI